MSMTSQSCKKQYLTVPNLLSLFRLALIPLFVNLYHGGAYPATAAVLVLSGATDVVDGWYARRFNAISDVGKVLDPIADKLTQVAMLLMLAASFPVMKLPLALLIIKETTAVIGGMLVIYKTGVVHGAVWHGKAATALLYGMMFILVLWQDIPAAAANTMATVCSFMLLLSMILYAADNIRCIQSGRRGEK